VSNGELAQGVFEGYDGGEEPLPSYAALAGLFNLILAVVLLIARKTGRPIPERIEARDIALLGVATHKLSLLLAKDAVTSPLRAPFTEPQERGREAPGKGPEEIARRAPDLPLLRWPVDRLLLHLRSGLRSGPHASDGQYLRYRRALRPPPPDLQGADEEGLRRERHRDAGLPWFAASFPVAPIGYRRSLMRGKLAAVAALVGAAGAYRSMRRPKPLRSRYSRAPRKILIVGGGFGGLAALDGLVEDLDGDPEVGVALLDRVNFTTFWPMVPSAISGNVEVRHIAHSIRRRIQPLGAEF